MHNMVQTEVEAAPHAPPKNQSHPLHIKKFLNRTAYVAGKSIKNPVRRKGFVDMCGNNSCLWIIIILIVLFACGGWGGCCDNGCDNGCNNGCGCSC